MATATKKRQGRTKHDDKTLEFPAGSLEAELSSIGKSVPSKDWGKVPSDYFANLDYYRYGGLRKK